MNFYLKDKKGRLYAEVQYIGTGDNSQKNNEIVVLSGSKMKKNPRITKKWIDCPWIDRDRRELIDKGYVVDYDQEDYVFVKNFSFSSPNKAACVCLGDITTKAWHEIVNKDELSLDSVYRN